MNQQKFHYVMPQDDEDVNFAEIEDQEAMVTRQTRARLNMKGGAVNKSQGSAPQFARITSNQSEDGTLMQENNMPVPNNPRFASQTDPDYEQSSQQRAIQENAYQVGADEQLLLSGVNPTFQGKQIRNQINQQQEQYFPVERLSNERTRPQSAKVSTQTQERPFGAQGISSRPNMRNQQQMLLNLTNHQSQSSAQWYASNSVQQQRMLGSGYSQQALTSGAAGFYPQAGIMISNRHGGGKSSRHRPGTAGRKARLAFGLQQKAAGNGLQTSSSNTIAKAASVSNLKLQSVAKLRPRIVQQEKERLFDDVIKQKMTTNNLSVDNTRLRTRIQMLEVELARKDKAIDEIMVQQNEQAQVNFGIGGHIPYSSGPQKIGGRSQAETHLVINLKRKIKDLNTSNLKKDEEIEALKKNIRSTQLQEVEVEIKTYIDECARLRQQLEEVMKSKDTFADPVELKTIQEQFQERDNLITKQQQDNADLSIIIQKKDEHSEQLVELVQELEKRLKKAQATKKVNLKVKKDVIEKDKSAFKLRKEINDLKSQNTGLAQLVREFKTSQILRSQPANPPRVSSGNSQSAAMSKQGEENRRLYFENQRLNDKLSNLEAVLKNLQKQLQDKEEQLTITNSDKVKFKDLSETYMKEVAHLESQLEAAAIKPKSKTNQRPKDTTQRDITQSLSQMNTQKVKMIEARQLKEEVQLLKLFLQQKFLQCDRTENMAPLLFGFEGTYDPNAQISIIELRDKFENLGFQIKQSNKLARYLVESNQNISNVNQSGEILYNENLTAVTQHVLLSLQQVIGQYYLYKEEGSDYDEDPHYVQEEYMQKLVYENFHQSRDTLIEALKCEDYVEQGLLELSQLLEAISTVNEELEPNVMDYMLYYVLVRSESHNEMQYKHLIDILDQIDGMQKQRLQSADRKNRPESASPENMKKRNLSSKSGPSHHEAGATAEDENQIDEEDYLEEEIAVDPDDEEDDGTNEVPKVEQTTQDDDQEFFAPQSNQLQQENVDNQRYQEGQDDYQDDEDDQEDQKLQLQPEDNSEQSLKALPQDSSEGDEAEHEISKDGDLQAASEVAAQDGPPMQQQHQQEEEAEEQDESAVNDEEDTAALQELEQYDQNLQEQQAEDHEEEVVDEEEEEEIDEDEVIDVAERIFIRIAEEIIKQDVTSIRDLFSDQLFEAEISGQILELLTPQGLVDGIKLLGIDDLTDKEIQYLLRVLTKPELEGAIVMQELLQIMENLGLYDDSQAEDGAENGEEGDEEVDEYGNTSRSDPTAAQAEPMDAEAQAQQDEEEAKVEAFIQQEQSSLDKEPDGLLQSTDSAGPAQTGESSKKKSEALDLSKLDQKSVKIMIMLMVHLLQQNQTTQEFFLDVLFEQKVKTKTRLFTMTFLKSDDFFRVLKEKGIRSKETEHPNLREFLQLSANNPQLLLLKNIRKTLEQMSENEAFMSAIQEDVLMSEQKPGEDQIQADQDSDQGDSSDFDDDAEDDEDGESEVNGQKAAKAGQEAANNDGRPEEEESKLNTVDEGDGEGTSNQGGATTTDEKLSMNRSLRQQQQQMGASQQMMAASASHNASANIPIRVGSHNSTTVQPQNQALQPQREESSSDADGEDDYESEEDDDEFEGGQQMAQKQQQQDDEDDDYDF